MVQTNFREKYFFVNTPIQRLTFEEYLKYEDNTDIKYELYRGKLIPMATPTALHTRICKYLAYHFANFFAENNLNFVAINDVAVRIGVDSARIPDVIITESQMWQTLCQRKGAGVFDSEEIPQIVIEITSENWREDYLLKRAEYALINIPEYWIVNPNKQRVRILFNPEKEDGYEFVEFVEGENIKSNYFSELVLSVSSILSPPIVEDLMILEKQEKQQLMLDLAIERQRVEKLERILKEKGITIDD